MVTWIVNRVLEHELWLGNARRQGPRQRELKTSHAIEDSK